MIYSTQYVGCNHTLYILTVAATYMNLQLSVEEQDKSSDIEQQPSYGDRKYSNTLPQKRGGG